jgi:hypothetical protein
MQEVVGSIPYFVKHFPTTQLDILLKFYRRSFHRFISRYEISLFLIVL